MPHLSIDRRLRWLLLAPLAALGAAGAFAQTPLAGPLRLVDVIEVNDHEDQADLTMVFNCSMRFINSLPASEGKEVHIQLAPLADCRVSPMSQLASETPTVSGGSGIVSAARVESMAPGQITLTLSFKKNERFVLAQGVDPRGLRLRLIDRARGRGKILVGQSTEEVSNFAINLDSQPKPFSPADVQQAHDLLKAPAFVSEAVVDGEKWYRLRVGPIEKRSEADRLLSLALPQYPRAWLAIGDDAVTSDANATTAQVALPPVERMGSDPSLTNEELKKLMTAARAAVDKHEYPTAIALLTKLQRQPEFPDRARAQELLGLARERSGQLAHAKAEYEEYLRRYPHGEAAERVAFRLKTLRAAEARARTGREVRGEGLGWEVTGGVAQTARYDGERITNGTVPTSTPVPAAPTINQNALFNDVDFFARRRGETFDLLGRLSAGYDKSFTTDQGTVGNATRVTLASIEVLDRSIGVLGRLGRQASNDYGILGTFDGLFLSWQFRPSWAINAAAGYPVEQLIIAPQTQDRFETVALAYTPKGAHWDASLFASNEMYQGFRARRAAGVEGRFLAPNVSLVGVVDYDTQFHSLNTASLVGTLQLPARWSLSFDGERRNSPVLTTRNALVGQACPTGCDLNQLEQIFTLDQIYQLAKDRTPLTTNYSITANKPLGARLQITTIVSATQTGATPASGGVAAVPATGMLLTYQGQLYGSSLWRTGDFHVLTLTHGNTVIGRIESISTNSRFPIGGAWRLGPRFTVNRLTSDLDGSTQTTYFPSVLLDYERERKLFQFEVGDQLGQREAFLQLSNGQFVQTQNTTRYYVSVSYRINFQ
jgi:tetratricopeptide (TPR) repeat protein